MAMQVDISNPLLYANDDFAQLMTDRNRFIVSYGSRDSGKSYNAAEKIVGHILSEEYAKAVLVRKIYFDIKESQYQTLLDVISDWKLDKYFYTTTNPLKIECLLNGNVIIARGLDKPTRLKSIKDPTLVWIEEADEISYQDFMTTNLSIRSNKDVLLQMILTLNSTDETCWINKHFFPPAISYQKEDGLFSFIKSIQKDTTILHSCYLNNRYCSKLNKKFYANLKHIDLELYKTSLLGLWGQIDETIIFKEVYYGTEYPTEEERKNHGIGLDFGFSNHPSTAIECCIAHGEIYVRELFYKTGLVNVTNKSDQMSIDKEFKQLGIRNEEIFPDSAEPKSIKELQNEGYNLISLPKEKGSIESGITSLKRYKINVINSPNIKKEARNYKYKKDKDGNITNIPIDAWNHAFDGIRYWHKGAVSDHKEVTFDIIK